MLTVMPECGLANRLFALHSAIRLSADCGQPLQVLWRIRRDFGCRLEDVLEVPPEIARIGTFDRRTSNRVEQLREIGWRLATWPPVLRYIRQREIEGYYAPEAILAAFRRPRWAAIRTYSLFYPGRQGFYPFRPTPPLAARIAAVTAGFGNTIGVHIRRTDHKPAIAHSPTELFVERMRALVADDPTVTFFVASDQPAETARLLAEFPGRVMTSAPATLARDSRAGIEGAVIDVYCLAATRRVLGSFASTFSQLAGLLGGRPVEYLTRNEPRSPVW